MDLAVSYTFYKSILAFLILLPAAAAYPYLIRRSLVRKQKQQLLLEFRDALGILSSFLSAGLSTENAFRSSLPELRQLLGPDAMIVREFQGIVNGFNMQQSLESLLTDFARRSSVDDILSFAEIYSTAKRNGGELVKIIGHTSGIIRDRISISEEILTLNASRQYEQKIMNLVPFLIILYMNVTSPDFFTVLYTTLAGRVVMTVCLGIYLLAIWISGKIMEIRV